MKQKQYALKPHILGVGATFLVSLIHNVVKNDYTTLANIINQYCIDNNIKDPEDNFFYYSEKEIKKNKIIHVVRWYLETTDKEYVSLFMDYKG